MGWKTLKEHYRIEHIVCVTKKGICIGSPYVHNLIVVSLEGLIINPNDGRSNADLLRYMSEMMADMDKLREVVQSVDTFSAAIPVYTYDGGNIIEEKCESLGWPNVTHNGNIMYNNTYSKDKSQVVKWAKRNSSSMVESYQLRAQDIKLQLIEVEAIVQKSKADLEKLNKDYPE